MFFSYEAKYQNLKHLGQFVIMMSRSQALL
jgi:hypothetical protein